ncbi:hypothetical protein PRIPAC_77837, partial [Pristionchus pacificus]|uniref:glucuronosyltransferase n=1 Tax=Pristionchus pacificus TaxID=54126 RepID=A0A2A6C3I7_PRIPA
FHFYLQQKAQCSWQLIQKTIKDNQFPEVTFIWKYEDPRDSFSTNHSSKLKNVVISNWIPQVDLLGDANTVVFITHGGMASVQEAARHGITVICVTIFGEQSRNGGMIQFNGLAIVYGKFELHNGLKLADAIREVLENRKYAFHV